MIEDFRKTLNKFSPESKPVLFENDEYAILKYIDEQLNTSIKNRIYDDFLSYDPVENDEEYGFIFNSNFNIWFNNLITEYEIDSNSNLSTHLYNIKENSRSYIIFLKNDKLISLVMYKYKNVHYYMIIKIKNRQLKLVQVEPSPILSHLTNIIDFNNKNSKEYYKYMNLSPIFYYNNKLNILFEADDKAYQKLNTDIKTNFIRSTYPFHYDDSSRSLEINNYLIEIKKYFKLFHIELNTDLYNVFMDEIFKKQTVYVMFYFLDNDEPVLQAFIGKIYKNRVYYAFENTKKFSIVNIPLLL